jgi:hypothetical protein
MLQLAIPQQIFSNKLPLREALFATTLPLLFFKHIAQQDPKRDQDAKKIDGLYLQ